MVHIQSLRDHVCAYIYDKIKIGQLKPKEKLNEIEISNDLQISRTPIREALIMLAADHIIDFVPRKGFYVREITVDDILQYYALMGTLDAFAATLALEHLNDDDMEKLKSITSEINKAISQENYDDYLNLQKSFHDTYINRANNKPLIETIHSLRDRYIPITYNRHKTDSKTYQNILYQTNKEHEKIIELFIEKDVAGIEQFIKGIHWDTKYIELL